MGYHFSIRTVRLELGGRFDFFGEDTDLAVIVRPDLRGAAKAVHVGSRTTLVHGTPLRAEPTTSLDAPTPANDGWVDQDGAPLPGWDYVVSVTASAPGRSPVVWSGRLSVPQSSGVVELDPSTSGQVVTAITSPGGTQVDPWTGGAEGGGATPSQMTADASTTAADITAWLADTSTLGVKRLHGEATISAAIVIPSNTHLDATGATIHAPSTAHPMLRNTAAVTTVGTPTTGGGANRDRDIKVVGGTWTAGTVNGAMHRLFFHQVDGVEVRDLTVTSQSGKYAVLFADVTNYRATNLDFDSASDGVHITGPAINGYISDLRGTNGDDTVGATGIDYDAYNYSRGSIEGLVVERLYTTTAHRAVLLEGCASATGAGAIMFRDVSLRDIHSAAGEGIKITPNTFTDNAVCVVDGVTIDRVSNEAVAGLGLVSFVGNRPGSYIGSVTARGLSLPRETTNSAGTTRRYGLYIDATDVRDVTAEMAIADVGTRQTRGVHVQGAAVVNRLAVSATSDMAIADSVVVNVEGTATVRDLEVRGTYKGGRGVRTANTATVSRATLSGTHTAGSYAVYHTAATAMKAHFVGWSSPSAVDVPVILAGTGTASLDITGELSTDRVGGPITGASASKTIRVYSQSIGAGLDKVSLAPGAMVRNVNSSLSAGVGVCVSDGTSWKNLFTGAVYPAA